MEKTVIILDPENNCVIIDAQVFRKEITEAHSSVVTGEKMMPELKGERWVRAIKDGFMNGSGERFCSEGRWYPLIEEDERYLIDTDRMKDHPWGKYTSKTSEYFDLDNPRDYQPHTVPSEIMEGLMMLPEDHPEFGNIRAKAIECAEKFGYYNGVDDGTGWPNKICKAIDWFDWRMDNIRHWRAVYKIASSGAFDTVSKIPFNISRWQSGDFVRVETREGSEVKHLTNFEVGNQPLKGLADEVVRSWGLNGKYYVADNDSICDLFLIVKA